MMKAQFEGACPAVHLFQGALRPLAFVLPLFASKIVKLERSSTYCSLESSNNGVVLLLVPQALAAPPALPGGSPWSWRW